MQTTTKTRGATVARGMQAREVGLLLMIGATPYAVRREPADAEAAERLFRLRKPDGTAYDVAQTEFGPVCDCPDFIFRRDGLDPSGCKHIRALVGYGMLPGRRTEPAVH